MEVAGRSPLQERVLSMRALFGFILFLLSVYGLANAIAVLKIGQFFFGKGFCHEKDCKEPRHPFDKRKFLGRIPYIGELFYCPPCLGFWIGMAFSLLVFSPASEFSPIPWKSTVTDGLAASGAIWLFHAWAMRTIEGIAEI